MPAVTPRPASGTTVDRLLSALAGSALLVLVALAFEPGRLAEEARDTAPEVEDVFRQLVREIAESGMETFDNEDTDLGRRPAADTAPMRQPGLFGDEDQVWRDRLSLVRLATSSSVQLGLLESMEEAPDPRLRYRAKLERATIQLRRGANRDALALVRAARAEPVPPPFLADGHFIEGYALEGVGEIRGALFAYREAIAVEPEFWNARQAVVALLGRELAGFAKNDRDCVEATHLLLENVGALGGIAQDRRLYLDLASSILRYAGTGDASRQFVVGMAFRLAGAEQAARRHLLLATSLRGRLPARCERLIHEVAATALKAEGEPT